MFAAGSKLGPYEITGSIGAGGMGEVYRARDSRLKRSVAIKIMPDKFAQDPERLARFQREAQLLASLSHPNIAVVYGIEQTENTHALVMELVDGETLADRLKPGPMPLDEALRIARQIAEALEAAHERGIVHRDLKPGNIMVTPDDNVKVLDFGLAKLAQVTDGGPAISDFENSLTITAPAAGTRPGVLLGTASYMSPEQVRSKPVDKRTDIWAFGCVLYEMLTGNRAFTGEDVSDVLVAVLTKPPDWSALDHATPTSIRRLLTRCVERDRKQRLADIADARIEIEDVLRASESEPVVGSPIGGAHERETRGAPLEAQRKPQRSSTVLRRIAAAAVTVAIVGAIAGWAVRNIRRPQPLVISRTTVGLPDGISLTNSAYGRDITITSDGTRIIFVANGGTQLRVRSLDQLDSTVLVTAPRSLTSPFVSPDNQWVGYQEDGALKKVPITGGPSVTLVTQGVYGGATWGPNDSIVFSPGPAGGLQSVPGNGGSPSVLTTAAYPREMAHILPKFLPDGQAVLFTILTATGVDNAEIGVLDLKSRRTTVLLQRGTDAHFVTSGQLIYGSSGSLHAVNFDPENLEVLGKPLPVLSGIVTKPRGVADFAVAKNGTLLYVAGVFGPGITPTRGELVTIARNSEPSVLFPMGDYREPRVSPDGKRLAVSDGSDIWMHDLSRGARVRLTSDGSATRPVWSPDGSRIVFRSAMFGEDVYSVASDGSGRPEPRLIRAGIQYSASVSPDGNVLAFDEMDNFGGRDIGVVRRDGKVMPLVATQFNERGARFSPDGRWVVYVSNESGRDEIYLRPYPGPGPKVAVSVDGGTEPVWSPAGNELFYRQGRRLIGVSVRTSPELVIGPPQVVIEGEYAHDGGPNTPSYDVFPDGQRFVMIRPDTQPALRVSSSLVLVQNWFEELKRLIPSE